jgi:hypothetical protein
MRYTTLPAAEIEAVINEIALTRGNGREDAILYLLSTGIRKLRSVARYAATKGRGSGRGAR